MHIPDRIQNLPGLLGWRAGPVQATHVTDSDVVLGERPEDTEHRVGHHDEQRNHPGGGDDTVGVGSGLPRAGLQRVADGAVSLDGDGHEAEGGDADRDPCRREKTANQSIHTCPRQDILPNDQKDCHEIWC